MVGEVEVVVAVEPEPAGEVAADDGSCGGLLFGEAIALPLEVADGVGGGASAFGDGAPAAERVVTYAGVAGAVADVKAVVKLVPDEVQAGVFLRRLPLRS